MAPKKTSTKAATPAKTRTNRQQARPAAPAAAAPTRRSERIRLAATGATLDDFSWETAGLSPGAHPQRPAQRTTRATPGSQASHVSKQPASTKKTKKQSKKKTKKSRQVAEPEHTPPSPPQEKSASQPADDNNAPAPELGPAGSTPTSLLSPSQVLSTPHVPSAIFGSRSATRPASQWPSQGANGSATPSRPGAELDSRLDSTQQQAVLSASRHSSEDLYGLTPPPIPGFQGLSNQHTQQQAAPSASRQSSEDLYGLTPPPVAGRGRNARSGTSSSTTTFHTPRSRLSSGSSQQRFFTPPEQPAGRSRSTSTSFAPGSQDPQGTPDTAIKSEPSTSPSPGAHRPSPFQRALSIVRAGLPPIQEASFESSDGTSPARYARGASPYPVASRSPPESRHSSPGHLPLAPSPLSQVEHGSTQNDYIKQEESSPISSIEPSHRSPKRPRSAAEGDVFEEPSPKRRPASPRATEEGPFLYDASLHEDDGEEEFVDDFDDTEYFADEGDIVQSIEIDPAQQHVGAHPTGGIVENGPNTVLATNQAPSTEDRSSDTGWIEAVPPPLPASEHTALRRAATRRRVFAPFAVDNPRWRFDQQTGQLVPNQPQAEAEPTFDIAEHINQLEAQDGLQEDATLPEPGAEHNVLARRRTDSLDGIRPPGRFTSPHPTLTPPPPVRSINHFEVPDSSDDPTPSQSESGDQSEPGSPAVEQASQAVPVVVEGPGAIASAPSQTRPEAPAQSSSSGIDSWFNGLEDE